MEEKDLTDFSGKALFLMTKMCNVPLFSAV